MEQPMALDQSPWPVNETQGPYATRLSSGVKMGCAGNDR